MAVTQQQPAVQAEPRLLAARSIRRRKRGERLVHVVTAAGLGYASQTPDLWLAHLGAAALGISTARWLWRQCGALLIDEGLTRAAHIAVPPLTAAAAYLTNVLHSGAPWWEWALAPAWGALMVATTPFTNAARLGELPLVAAQSAPAIEAAPGDYLAYRARQWENAKATGTTRLVGVHQYTDQQGQLLQDFWGTVVAEQGEAVPDLNETALAAVFDLPVGTVWLQPMDGSGPGRKHLLARPTLGSSAQSADPIHRIWNARVAGPNGAAPGMILDDYRLEPNRIALRVTAPENQIINLDQKKLARAFKYKDLTLVTVETDGLGDGIISLYKTHPLMHLREATVADLTMADDGTIQIGVRHDGRPARMALYDPVMGAVTDLFAGAPGAGKSVTLNYILAAERISGVVSIVADAQNGMSLPEADGRVYHFGKGIAATGATLAGSNALAKYREEVSAANGWSSAEINDPWPLVNVTLDELNRILAEDADVPRHFRKWVTGMVGDEQSTGRKLLKGIRFAAQSIHLEDLGDKDRIRANAKNGLVWLGRTNSSTTQHMATDGVLPPGVTVEPISRHFSVGSSSDIDAAFHGKDLKKGPLTAGLANYIQDGVLFTARTWNARKENKTYPGIIALYESAPIPVLTPEEDRVFKEAYAKALEYAELLLSGANPKNIGHGDFTADEVAEAQALIGEDEDEDGDDLPVHVIKHLVLELLADGQDWEIRTIRARIKGANPLLVNTAVGELQNDDKKIEFAGRRGAYRLASNPIPTD
ncbi:hypothetical protein [Streptomyces sp. MZ04]|uniref:hypothetical protein n=1 Tax=Streptomyces sp. MZ04 TaxID=2559236 RepID=UPI00107EC89D|nr:hypothetical protein [Streptomyces sp. MZ04]TGB06549.1 hypothetical protein E2651_23340 [Streptomyces sp. MZ04]